MNISDLRDGQRHDRWLPLQNIKMGRLHLAITVLEDNKKVHFPFNFFFLVLRKVIRKNMGFKKICKQHITGG